MEQSKDTEASVIEKYLQENDIELLNDNKPPLEDFNDITSEDECWLVQCPKSINLTKLNGRKIKLPGKTNNDLIETIAEDYGSMKTSTFGIKKGKRYSLKNLPIRGRILIRNKIQIIKTEGSSFKLPKKKKVPFPENLKIRHPIHGVNYKERIVLSGEIQDRLKDHKGNVNLLKRTNENVEIKNEFETTEVTIKKEKKHKSKNVSPKKPIESKKRKTKQNINEEIPSDLAWIKEL